MSTYINPIQPNKHDSYSDCPPVVTEYLNYAESIRGLSPRTVNGYYIDLRVFFKYLVQLRGLASQDLPLEEIKINWIDIAFIKQITKAEIYEYLYYATRERTNAPAARARKLSSIKGLFNYLHSKVGLLQNNPAADIESPKIKKTLPKYLSLDESLELLNNIQSDFPERDFCILTLFLNCGMRLSELATLNETSIKNDTMRVVGKGNKERTLYLNQSCTLAIDNMLDAKQKLGNIKDDKALFISKKTGKRLSVRRIQQIVDAALQSAGLSGKGYSTHKLRHTAATLLYQHGNADMLALKEILGHAHVSTTEIYTHMDSAALKEIARTAPLSSARMPKTTANNDEDNKKKENDKE